jgi:hypothetical protein
MQASAPLFVPRAEENMARGISGLWVARHVDWVNATGVIVGEIAGLVTPLEDGPGPGVG